MNPSTPLNQSLPWERRHYVWWGLGTALLALYVVARGGSPPLWGGWKGNVGCTIMSYRYYSAEDHQGFVKVHGDSVYLNLLKDQRVGCFLPRNLAAYTIRSNPYLVYHPETDGGFTLGTIGPDAILGTADDYFQRWPRHDRLGLGETFAQISP
jgi:hypothetical protein